ncbi:cytochrome C551 [Chryseobacterium piscium]|uniref:Cytochrome C551 n=1 Tax=Chryseobacterium piscium TaxID=333702 RepID=A0A3D9BF16_9FLAO|nr:cytochrome C551 [Chryseobacterium piscium]REC52012.1 cytochrome C551 [Chryseobacterium piscium]
MKKLMLFAFGIGLVAASCGSKEPQMSSENKDSMNITADTTANKDSMPMQNTDTMKMPVDTVVTPVK